MKDYIKNIEGAERRSLTETVTLQTRGEGDETESIIEGYAAKFGKRTNLGWFDEIIERGAFDDNLNDDVKCLIK